MTTSHILSFANSCFRMTLHFCQIYAYTTTKNLVMFLSVLVDWMIPDIPTDISDQIKKEKSLLVDFFLKEEHEKVKLADEPAQRSQGGGDRSRRSRAASSAPSGRSQPGSIASSGSQHTNV